MTTAQSTSSPKLVVVARSAPKCNLGCTLSKYWAAGSEDLGRRGVLFRLLGGFLIPS